MVGNQVLSPGAEPLRMHSPGAINLITLSVTVQTDGVLDTTTGGITNPRVTDLEETWKYAVQLNPLAQVFNE